MRRNDITVDDRRDLATLLTPARRPGRIDGLKVRVIDDAAPSGADLGRALRTLARLMVRSYRDAGDHTAITAIPQSSPTLTVVPHPRPDHDTNNEAA